VGRLRVTLLCGLLSFAAATPASAATVPTPFLYSSQRVPIASDGGPYLAYQLNATGIRLYDPVAHTTRDVVTGSNCRLIGMVARKAFVACDQREVRNPPTDTGTRGVLVDVKSGMTQDLTAGADWLAIGKRWAVGSVPDPSHPPQMYLANWRTGELRINNETYGPFDLDAEDPVPLPSKTLYRTRVGRVLFTHTVTSYFGGFDSILTLRRSRAHRRAESKVIWREYGPVFDPSFSSGLVTWATETTAHGYDVARSRRLNWTFPGYRRHFSIDPVDVAHTHRHAFFEVPVAGGYELYKTLWRP
jgi:hypothetical protein